MVAVVAAAEAEAVRGEIRDEVESGDVGGLRRIRTCATTAIG